MIVAKRGSGETVSLGSGFFVRQNVVATAYHVVKGATALYAKSVGEQRIFQVRRILAVDTNHDLAILEVDAVERPVLLLADGSNVEVGEEVYAAGNPEGLEGTFSQGIVSAIRRMGKEDVIQITAPLSHGSSGGPVLNKQGQVIAVAVGAMRNGQNLNFAIPAPYLQSLLLDYLNKRLRADTSPASVTSDTRGLKRGKRDSKKGSGAEAGQVGQTEDVVEIPLEVLKARREVRRNPKSAEAHYRLARALAYGEEAISEYWRALELKPDFVDAYLNLGHLYEDSFDDQKNEAAAQTYKRVIAINPDLIEGHIGLGCAYVRLRRYDDAVRELDLSIRLKPDSAAAYRELGTAYELFAFDQKIEAISNASLRGKSEDYYAKAIQSYTKATQIEPKDDAAWYRLGDLYLELKRYRDAIGVLKQCALLSDSNLCFDTLFDAYEKGGLLLEGTQTMQLWIRDKPDNYMAHFTLGRMYAAQQNTKAALDEYKALKSLNQEYIADMLFKKIYR